MNKERRVLAAMTSRTCNLREGAGHSIHAAIVVGKFAEITRFYSPGFEPVVFDVDGYRFGCAICIEVNFPSIFVEYDNLGVDCLLLSAWPVDSIFYLKARAHA